MGNRFCSVHNCHPSHDIGESGDIIDTQVTQLSQGQDLLLSNGTRAAIARDQSAESLALQESSAIIVEHLQDPSTVAQQLYSAIKMTMGELEEVILLHLTG